VDWRIVLKLILNKRFKVVDSVDMPRDVTIRALGNTVVNLQLGRTVAITLPDKMTAALSKQSLPPDVGDEVGNVKTRLQKLAAFTVFAYTVERWIATALCSVL
jgi:hypothetical protein